MHGKVARIKISVLQGLHGNRVILPCMMVYVGGSSISGAIGVGDHASALLLVGQHVEWSGDDSRVVWMGARAKNSALLIFDFWLHVDLVFSEALTRNVKVGQHRELDLRL